MGDRQNIPSEEYTGSKPQFRKLEVGTFRARVRGEKTRELMGDLEHCFVTEI